MKNIGIWIDRKNAKIVRLAEDGETLETVMSEVEFFNRKGNSKPKTKWGGPQDVVHESTYEEREKHQLKAYFENVVHRIQDADALAIYGPADTGEKFRKELLEKHKQLAEKIVIASKADSMTDNQLIAVVRDFYSK